MQIILIVNDVLFFILIVFIQMFMHFLSLILTSVIDSVDRYHAMYLKKIDNRNQWHDNRKLCYTYQKSNKKLKILVTYWQNNAMSTHRVVNNIPLGIEQ